MSSTTTNTALGIKRQVPRRDFLYGSLITAGVTAFEVSPRQVVERFGIRTEDLLQAYTVAHPGSSAWDGESVGDAAACNADAMVIIGPGAMAPTAVEETGEEFDLVVVGGGLSGLAAAYYFQQAANGRARILILENHRMFGGNSRRDEFTVQGATLYAPQASTVTQELSPALAPSPRVAAILRELEIDLDRVRVPQDSYSFTVFSGPPGKPAQWYPNMLAAPLPEAAKSALGSLYAALGAFYDRPDWRQELASLDQLTFAQHLREQNWDAGLFQLMVPELAAFFGFPDAVSAATVYSHYAGKGPRTMYAFPGGNAGLVRQFVKRLIPQSVEGHDAQQVFQGRVRFENLDRPKNPVRLRLEASAVRVEHEGNPGTAGWVGIIFSQHRRLYRSRARAVVMAAGGFVTQKVVADLPGEKREAYAQFIYAPVLWANVVLNSSRALDRAGLNFLSTYPDGLGSVLLRFDKMHAGAEEQNFDRPAVIGILAPRFYPGLPAREQEVKARAELLETPFRSYESRIREDLARVLGPWGFDAAREIAAITLHRWAHHGYVFGYPGFFSGEAVRIASRLHGRIAFAHTDLHRFSVVLGAIEQGYRAAQELADKTWKYGSALGQAQMPAAS